MGARCLRSDARSCHRSDPVFQYNVDVFVAGLHLNILHASTDHEIDAPFGALASRRPSGIVINPDRFFQSGAGQLAALALRHSVPAIYHYREFAAAGGLMSYGGS